MSKRTLYLLGILTTILLGVFLYPKFCCKDCCKKTTESTLNSSATINKIGSNYSFKLNSNVIVKTKSTSKDPNGLIASNTRPEGKAKNKRTVLTLK